VTGNGCRNRGVGVCHTVREDKVNSATDLGIKKILKTMERPEGQGLAEQKKAVYARERPREGRHGSGGEAVTPKTYCK